MEPANPTLRQYAKFFELQKSQMERKDDYFLFIVGREFQQKDLQFLTFANPLHNALTDPKPDETLLSKILEKVLSLYT